MRGLRFSLRLCAVAGILLFFSFSAFAQTKRLVVIKCDGLPYEVVDRYVKQRDPQSGKSVLPWIDYIFYQRGARLSNFYVRGMSLSAPSWSLLETGQHLQIKGNVEFDRFTLHSYDYLNFFPLYLAGARGQRIDMRAVEVLDSLGLPMLSDAYPHNERYITYSIFLRNPRYSTLQASLQNKFMKSPKELFDEWTMGFEMRSAITDQLVRELTTNLNDPRFRYLDLMMEDFDHIAHHNNDVQSHLFVLKRMDAVIGQVWTAIQKSPLADQTAMVLISDHGINSDEKVYSQGYNLVKLLGSKAGGGHHVVTKRRLMLDYSIKGVNPLVPLITTTTDDTYYLKGESTTYPTAMLDFDGNERASLHLRDSDLNILHILLQQLQRGGLTDTARKAATHELFAVLERRHDGWEKDLKQLNTELGALDRAIADQRKLWEAQPKKFTKEQQDAGLDDAAKRIYVQLDRWQMERKEYSEYAVVLQNLLSLSSESFSPSKIKIADVIPQMAELAHKSKIPKKLIVNVAPVTDEPVAESIELVSRAYEAGADGVILNGGCPNVITEEGGRHEILSTNPRAFMAVLNGLRPVTRKFKPVFVRTSPQRSYDNTKTILRIAEGSKAVSAVFKPNSFNSPIPLQDGKKVLGVKGDTAGKTGPATAEDSFRQARWAKEILNGSGVSLIRSGGIANFEKGGISAAAELRRTLALGALGAGTTFYYEAGEAWEEATDRLLRGLAA